MELFVVVILWVLLVAVAIGGAILSYRSSARSRWLWGGVLLVVAGVVAAYSGFGWAWMASLDGNSQTPGMIMFLAGLAGTFAGIGMLAGRALRASRDLFARSLARGDRPRTTRVLVTSALACFLGSQACLVLYLTGYLSGSATEYAAAVISFTLIAAWILGSLALRAAGGRVAATAFLLVAPWPILAVDAVTFMFSWFPGVYVVMVAAVLVVVRLAVALAFPGARMPRGRIPARWVSRVRDGSPHIDG